MKNVQILSLSLVLASFSGFSQNPPWKNPLRMAWSNDGINFGMNSMANAKWF